MAIIYESNDHTEDDPNGSALDNTTIGGDIALKYKGISFSAEYFHRVSEPEQAGAEDFRAQGWTAQAGYFIYKRYVEVAARCAVVDPTNVATGTYVVPLGTNPTAEINATGKVVYGYNLRITAAGQYEITFVIPSVDITRVDARTYVSDPLGPDTVTLVITVVQAGGGGRPR